MPRKKKEIVSEKAQERQEAPSVREIADQLKTRIVQVMAAHGRKPGSLRAISVVLDEMLRTTNPMLDSRAVPRGDGKRVPIPR